MQDKLQYKLDEQTAKLEEQLASTLAKDLVWGDGARLSFAIARSYLLIGDEHSAKPYVQQAYQATKEMKTRIMIGRPMLAEIEKLAKQFTDLSEN